MPVNAVLNYSYFEIVKLLLENSADIIVLNNNRLMLVNIASNYSYLEVVKLLLENGIDIIVLNNNR